MDVRPQQKVVPTTQGSPLPNEVRPSRTKKRLFSKIGIGIVVLTLLLLASIAANVYQYLQVQDYRKTPTKAAQEEQTRVTELVRKRYQIPTYTTKEGDKDVTKEDTPQIATITDITKMKGQAFFDKAQNGDYIVVFPNTRIALIYREKTDQIINSGPVTVDANQQASKLNVKIYGAAGDRDAAEQTINTAFPGSTTITKLDAGGKVGSTVVVDVSGKNAVAAEQLASKLKNAKVGSAPAGQPVPDDVEIAIYTTGQ